MATLASVKFHYKVGRNPTATTNMIAVAADTLVHVGVRAGDKISAVAAA